MTKILLLASGENQDCGINTYTSSLENALTVEHRRIGIKSRTTDLWHYIRSTVTALRSPGEVIHLQHEYGVFGPASICSWAILLLMLAGKKFFAKRIVITLHSAWNEETPDPPLVLLKSFYIWLNNRLILLTADHVIFLSENTYKSFSHRHNIQNYSVMTHGVQTETVDQSRNEAKKAIGHDEFLIVEPGYIRPQKGHETFLEIAELLPDTQFVIAGGDRTGDHKKFVDTIKANASENVKITGVLDERDFHNWLLAADIVLLPYEEVTQSGIFNWAVAYSRPMVVKETEYFRDLRTETDGVRCFTSPQEAAELLDDLRNDPNTLSEMSKSLESYRAANSMHKIAERHRKIYEGTDV